MDLTDSLHALDNIFRDLFAPNEIISHDNLNPHAFSEAWHGARHFRDQSLLLLARYASSSVFYNELSLEETVSRLVDFTFRFFPKRQIAFTFDLASSLINTEKFKQCVIEYVNNSPYSTTENVYAATSGLTSAYFFAPNKLVNICANGETIYSPLVGFQPGTDKNRGTCDLNDEDPRINTDLAPFETLTDSTEFNWLNDPIDQGSSRSPLCHKSNIREISSLNEAFDVVSKKLSDLTDIENK